MVKATAQPYNLQIINIQHATKVCHVGQQWHGPHTVT